MKDKHNLSIGDTYGEWTVLSDYFFKKSSCRSYKYLKLQCSCGNIKEIRIDALGLKCHSCSTKENNLNRRAKREYITDGAVTRLMFNDIAILIDTDMVKHIDNILWRVSKKDKRVRGEDSEGRTIFLYRYLFEVKGIDIDGKQIDHINRDTLDNRFCNLNIVNASENNENKGMLSRNSSGFSGVSWMRSKNKWRARITKDRKEYHLGLFDTKEEAIQARLKAEDELFKYKASIKKDL